MPNRRRLSSQSSLLYLAVNLFGAECKRAQSSTPNSRVMSLINKGVWPECRPQSQSPILFSTGIQLTSFLKWVIPNTGDSELPLKKRFVYLGIAQIACAPRMLYGHFGAPSGQCFSTVRIRVLSLR